MPFEEIKKVKSREVAVSSDKVYIGLYGRNYVTIRIGEKVREKLGWEVRCRVSIAEGTGADKGLVQINVLPNDKTGSCFLRADGKNAPFSRIQLQAKYLIHHQVEAGEHPSALVSFQTFGSALTLIFPDWIKPVEKRDLLTLVK